VSLIVGFTFRLFNSMPASSGRRTVENFDWKFTGVDGFLEGTD